MWSGVCGSGGGGLLPVGVVWGVSQHALRQWTESQTPVKTLPWPNFVAAGNKIKIMNFGITQFLTKMGPWSQVTSPGH